MNESAVERRVCRFPGCPRPAEPGDPTAGRPPEYCDDPDHNRGSAWRARRRLANTDTPPPAGEETRPVDAARARSGQLTAQVTGMSEHLIEQLTRLLDELRTLADPDVAETHIAAVTADAAEQVAAAAARATRAEQAQHAAAAHADEANAAATEATTLNETLTHEVAALTETLTHLRSDHAALHDEHTALTRDHDTQQARLAATEHDLHAAIEARDTAHTQAQQHQHDRDRANAAAEQLRTDLATAHDHAAQLRADLATATAERDAARAETDRERSHADQRVHDLHTTYSHQLDALNTALGRPGVAG